MREIKFRGKRKDNGEWIEGYYAYKELSDEHFIIVPTFDPQYTRHPQYFTDHLVDADTVCQYTGLKDKDEKEIWEGDILTAEGMYNDYVIFENGTFRFAGGQMSIVEDWDHYSSPQVIGNVYENPELAQAIPWYEKMTNL